MFNDMVTSQAVAPGKPIGGAEIYKRTQLSWQLYEQQHLFPAHIENHWLAFNSDGSAI
jgi:hypothetical protein